MLFLKQLSNRCGLQRRGSAEEHALSPMQLTQTIVALVSLSVTLVQSVLTYILSVLASVSKYCHGCRMVDVSASKLKDCMRQFTLSRKLQVTLEPSLVHWTSGTTTTTGTSHDDQVTISYAQRFSCWSLYHNWDSTTIWRYHDAFDYQGRDQNYDMHLFRLRYDYDTTTTKNWHVHFCLLRIGSRRARMS